MTTDWKPSDLCMIGDSFYPKVYVGAWGRSKRKWCGVTIFGYPTLLQRALRADLRRPTPKDIRRVREAVEDDLARAQGYYTRAMAELDWEERDRRGQPGFVVCADPVADITPGEGGTL